MGYLFRVSEYLWLLREMVYFSRDWSLSLSLSVFPLSVSVFLRPVSQALFDLREIRNRSIVIGTRALVKAHLRLRRRKQSGLRLSFRVYTGYHRSPLSVNQERRSGAPWNLSSARTIEDCDTREITSATNTCLSCHPLEEDQDVRFPQLIDDQSLNEFFILLKNYK